MNHHSTTQSGGTRRSQGRAVVSVTRRRLARHQGRSKSRGEKNSGSIPGVYRPKYRNTVGIGQDFLNTWGLSAKIPKHWGFMKDQPLDFWCDSDKPLVLEKKLINPQY